jgi:hypothetical protein
MLLGMEEEKTPRPSELDGDLPSHPLMNSNRPPGGTRRSGIKTPRKVQWQDDDEQPEASRRALDERGVDVRDFYRLPIPYEVDRGVVAWTT